MRHNRSLYFIDRVQNKRVPSIVLCNAAMRDYCQRRKTNKPKTEKKNWHWHTQSMIWRKYSDERKAFTIKLSKLDETQKKAESFREKWNISQIFSTMLRIKKKCRNREENKSNKQWIHIVEFMVFGSHFCRASFGFSFRLDVAHFSQLCFWWQL